MEIVKAKKYWDYIEGHFDISENDSIERYTNIWGEQVLKVKNERIIINPNPNKPGDKIDLGGHVPLEGYYNIDEEGNEVFAFNDFDEYIRIEGKVRLIERVNEVFKNKDFTLSVGPNNSVALDDVSIVPNCYWHLPKKADELDEKSQQIINKVNDFTIIKISDNEVSETEQLVIESVCSLDVTRLSKLRDDYMYSYNFKDELIIEFSSLFKKLLIDGIIELEASKSECLCCYPNLNTYSFHTKDNHEFKVRYVIGKHPTENMLVVEECKNRSQIKQKELH